MPLNFLRKKKSDAPKAAKGAAAIDGAPAPVKTPVSMRSGVAFDVGIIDTRFGSGWQ